MDISIPSCTSKFMKYQSELVTIQIEIVKKLMINFQEGATEDDTERGLSTAYKAVDKNKILTYKSIVNYNSNRHAMSPVSMSVMASIYTYDIKIAEFDNLINDAYDILDEYDWCVLMKN